MSNYLDVYVKDAAQARPRRRRRDHLRRTQIRHAAVAGSGAHGEPRFDRHDVVSALQEQNVQVAAGQVGQPPVTAGQAFQISVRAIGRLTRSRRNSRTSF